MSPWDADLYLQFGDERTQPVIDLVSRLTVSNPKRIIDLGCGPGNSTAEMISAASRNAPDQEWILADASVWQAALPYDIVFSNAALQWIGNHDQLVRHLLDQVAPGGALAFQIPNHMNSPLHRLTLEIAEASEWSHRMTAAKQALTVESPSFYYDALVKTASKLDIWETEYCHVMEDTKAIVQWISSTGLRPFLACLDTKDQQQRFIALLTERLDEAYPRQENGKVLFPFRRRFVSAYR
jgi:trans-aconitate 2-methyltransferase